MSDAGDIWSHFERASYRPNTDSAWFLFEPAEPPLPCTEAAAKVWYQMEREMWAFCVSECCTDEVEPLFPVPTPVTVGPATASDRDLPAHLL